jgi:hypothetical protein
LSRGARSTARRRPFCVGVGVGGLLPAATLFRQRTYVSRLVGLSVRAWMCNAPLGERCSTPTGREPSRIHAARLRPARWQSVWRPAVWEELERRGATVAVVSFRGYAGQGAQPDTIKLLRLEDELLVEVERWTGRDQLCDALKVPVWDRFGSFAGQPPVRGELVWSTEDRRVAICGNRGDSPFEELAA